MPEWLLNALRNYEFTEHDKDDIAKAVLKSRMEWHKINDRYKPTNEDRNRVYDM